MGRFNGNAGGFPKGVPIIGTGAHRSWKTVRCSGFTPLPADTPWPKTGQTVGEVFPFGMYLYVIEGVRSDDEPCGVAAHIDGKFFQDPVQFGQMLSQQWAMFESYRTCACVKGVACRVHRPASAPVPATPLISES